LKKNVLVVIFVFLASATVFSQKKGNTVVVKQCLDSIVSTDGYKTVFSYDSNGNKISNISYRWNKTTNDWVWKNKFEYTYDNNGNTTMGINLWGGTMEDNKYEIAYDSNNKETTVFNYEWNSVTKNWAVYEKSEYTYDNNGMASIEITYRFDKEINSLERRFKTEYTHENNSKTRIGYVWEQEINNWRIYSKSECFYDNNGNLTIRISYRWDNAINDWIFDSKFEATYDNNGNRTTGIEYDFRQKETNDWLISYKHEYNYDNRGNLTIDTYYDWDKKTKSWEWKRKTEYEFYPFYSQKDLIMPARQYVGENMLIKESNYKWSKTDWVEDEITTYYWSEKKQKNVQSKRNHKTASK